MAELIEITYYNHDGVDEGYSILQLPEGVTATEALKNFKVATRWEEGWKETLASYKAFDLLGDFTADNWQTQPKGLIHAEAFDKYLRGRGAVLLYLDDIITF